MTACSWRWASRAGSRTDELPTRPSARCAGRDGSIALVSWVRSSINRVNLEVLRDHARESILDVNDGITSAAGIAEGFISAGASTRTLLLAGTAVILAGGSAAAGARYSEVRTEWEMDRALLEVERASIEADPAGEFEELVGIYEAKVLNPELARQVAEALTELDPGLPTRTQNCVLRLSDPRAGLSSPV